MSCDKICLKVSLNSSSTGCFYTGNIITGTVNLDLDKDQTVESIDLEVVGVSQARWTRTMPTMPYIKIYSEKKKVLYIKTANIFGEHRRGNIIPAGIYSYPFHFVLPHDLPSTFKSSLAKVYYAIKIKSKPKYKITTVFPFNVLGNVNINHVDEMLRPWLNEQKIFKKSENNITIHLRTYKGIASRQTIPFEITINNTNKIRISELKITLIQKLKYTIHAGWAVEEKNICKVNNKSIGKSVCEMCTLTMDIPPVTPSSIYLTEPMIDISYVFRVEVYFPFHCRQYEDIPVTVASVPVIHYKF